MPSMNYLYIEDDRLSRDLMELLLRNMLGITSYAIWENGQNFIPRLEALDPQPDVFMLDIHMEPFTGFELLTMIRQHPDFKEHRVYALTASVMNEEIDQLRAAGFDGVIGKPLDADTFPELIKEIEAGMSVWKIA